MKIKLNNGSEISVVRSVSTTRGKQSKDIEWSKVGEELEKIGARNSGKNKIIIDASESFLRDVWNGKSDFKEVTSMIGYNELRYLTHCARQFHELYDSSHRVMQDMTKEYERVEADRDYWKEKYLLLQRQ